MRIASITVAVPAVLALASSPSAQAPKLTDVKLLTGDDLLAAAAGEQTAPVLAAGGDGHLVVWSDQRTHPESSFSGPQSGVDVWAARLGADGTLLDPTGIVVSDAYGAQTNAQVAWNGENWLVAWENQSPTQFFYATEIQAVRVSPDGQVLDQEPIALVTYGSSSSVDFALTANGSDWCVVARGTSAGPETAVVARRVAAGGGLPEAAPVAIHPDGGPLVFSLDIVSTAGEYLVVFSQSGTSFARRLDSELDVLGDIGSIPGLTLASNGTHYYVVWSSGGNYVGSPMSATGTLLVPAGAVLTPSASIFELNPDTLGWDGSQWWVSWRHAFDGIEATRVTTSGQVLDPNGVPLDPSIEDFVREHALAGVDGGGARLAWQDDRAGGIAPNDIRLGAFSSAAAPTVGDPASLALPAQTAPDLAAGSSGYLEVHRSIVSGLQRILAQPLDGFGNAVSAPVELAAGPSLGTPDVAWNGAVFLVTWPEDSQILARRVAEDGTPIDGSPSVVMDGYSCDVAALGDDFLVVATYQTISVQFVHPFGVRVDGPTGAVLDPVPIALGQYFARNLDVTTVGGRWLATWQRNFSHDDPGAEVRAIFVEPDGSHGGDFSVGIGGQPAVAASPSTALIAWRTGTDNSSNPDLVARRYLADGTSIDASAFTLSSAADKQLNPTAVWNGSEFVVAWEDLRTAETFFDERTDVYTARVSESGSVLDAEAFEVFDEQTPTREPRLATFSGRTLLAAGRFLNEAGSYRVALRGLGDWAGLGNALAGSSGLPVLDAAGQFTAGSTIELAVSSAFPSSPGLHVLGLSRIDLPLLGGVLVPDPLVVLGFGTDAQGGASSALPIVNAVPPGVDLFVQSWIVDPGGLQSFSATNATGTTSP